MPDDGTLFPFLLFMVGVWFFAFLGSYTGRVSAERALKPEKDADAAQPQGR